jgi:hypothetical protein
MSNVLCTLHAVCTRVVCASPLCRCTAVAASDNNRPREWPQSSGDGSPLSAELWCNVQCRATAHSTIHMERAVGYIGNFECYNYNRWSAHLKVKSVLVGGKYKYIN